MNFLHPTGQTEPGTAGERDGRPYGPHWRDLPSIVDEVRRGVGSDDPWSENAVVDSLKKVYAQVFSEEQLESPHYQSLRRGITRGVRALEAEYAAEEAEREQRFQEFWSERYLTREVRTPYSESWTVWATDSGERYADATLQILERETVITLVLPDEDDLLPIIDALERDFPVDRPARYICWTLKTAFAAPSTTVRNVAAYTPRNRMNTWLSRPWTELTTSRTERLRGGKRPSEFRPHARRLAATRLAPTSRPQDPALNSRAELDSEERASGADGRGCSSA